mgnify:CR=1 FL=1
MKVYQEHELEAAPGLPEALPPGERILWQGRPDWRRLASEAFHVDAIAVYFSLMIALHALLSWRADASLAQNLLPLLWSGTLALVALGLLALSAWLSARTTMYTLTNKRVVMRIGIVLTVSFNLPLRWVAAAHLKPGRDGSGDIALELKGSDRIAYLHLWPHARAWQLKKPQPALRCVTDVKQLGERLHHAWQQRRAETGEIERQERIPVRMPATAMAR